MHASVYIATSVDGYIARPDGAIDWLDSVEIPEGDDLGYAAFIDSIDALVMGRNTFEVVMAMDVDWPYTVPVHVVSRRGVEIPEELADRISHRRETPNDLCASLDAEGVSRIWVDGGALISSFLAKGLIDRIIITTLPLLLGEGIPLFGSFPGDISLRLESVTGIANGMTQTTYEVAKAQR